MDDDDVLKIIPMTPNDGLGVPLTPMGYQVENLLNNDQPMTPMLDSLMYSLQPMDSRQRSISFGGRSRSGSFDFQTEEDSLEEIWAEAQASGFLMPPAPPPRETVEEIETRKKKSRPLPPVFSTADGKPKKYTKEQRKEKIARFVEKRSRRVWRKEIKYTCRKQFAESRPRVAGRFIPRGFYGEIKINPQPKLGILLKLQPSAVSPSSSSSMDWEDDDSLNKKKPLIRWDRETSIVPVTKKVKLQ